MLFAPLAAPSASAYYACRADQGDTCNGVKALLLGGHDNYAVLTEEQMATAFGGYFAVYDSRTSVPFPGNAPYSESIPAGATNLYNAVLAEPDGTVMTIGGVSQGSPSVMEALKRLENLREAGSTDVPDADHMNVLMYGTPSPIFYTGSGYYPRIPTTPYDIYMVSAEYDGIADMPDNLFNILAVLNAIEGADRLHVDAAFNIDFANDPLHYKQVTNKDNGTTTYVVIPYKEQILPLLKPWEEAGADPVRLAKLSAFLKPIIDSAYRRNGYFEKKKWVDGLVSIPLPAAATPDAGATTVTTTAATAAKVQNAADVVTPPAQPTDYVGKHRAAEPTGNDTANKDTKKVARDFVKHLKNEIKKLTTKKTKTESSSQPKTDEKDEKDEKKDTTANETAKESSSSSVGSSDTGSES
ncbi:PE-PPE domain-containing protein [Mycolicibacterium psychrotolerans]|nr:PE-PPE domain-containing protein [Mycolicibacterium psychrotolerans]